MSVQRIITGLGAHYDIPFGPAYALYYTDSGPTLSDGDVIIIMVIAWNTGTLYVPDFSVTGITTSGADWDVDINRGFYDATAGAVGFGLFSKVWDVGAGDDQATYSVRFEAIPTGPLGGVDVCGVVVQGAGASKAWYGPNLRGVLDDVAGSTETWYFTDTAAGDSFDHVVETGYTHYADSTSSHYDLGGSQRVWVGSVIGTYSDPTNFPLSSADSSEEITTAVITDPGSPVSQRAIMWGTPDTPITAMHRYERSRRLSVT